MAKIEEAIWQGQEPPGRFLCLHDAENLLTRSLFLLPQPPLQAVLRAAGPRNSIVGLWVPALVTQRHFVEKGSEETLVCNIG